MLRLLHTSDWHLGHTLHEFSRAHEHALFLEWLLDVIDGHDIDALLVAGDVFDTANPSAEAQETFYRFLARARLRRPRLGIVVIGGNHDSAARLDAPDPILRSLGVHVVGGLPQSRGVIDLDRVIVPLKDRDGAITAWIAAVPFLRPADLPSIDDCDDPLIEGVRRIYQQVIEGARARREGEQALLAMGHCYMTGTQLSDLSERKILGGNQHALPVDIFPGDVAYVALGHLHLAQRVGDREHVRYSGSPIPLALDEEHYRHQVLVVEIDGPKLQSVTSLEIPRAVPILRLPAKARPLAEVLQEISKLPALDASVESWRRPYLEVRVLLDKPEPSLRHEIDKALEGKAPRLARIKVETTGTGAALADSASFRSLRDTSPEDVFRMRYQRDHEGEPSPELLAAFHEILAEAEGALA